VPFLSASDVVYDDALYKWTFTLLYLLHFHCFGLGLGLAHTVFVPSLHMVASPHDFVLSIPGLHGQLEDAAAAATSSCMLL